MLEKFKIEGNCNRQNVLKYVQNSKFNLEKFEIIDFQDYPGGIALVDKKKRKIIIYDDFIVGKIQVIYEARKKNEEELIFEIREYLWDNYMTLAQYLNQVAIFERRGKKDITFFRFKVEENMKAEKIHTSPTFNEYDELYDIYDYLEKEIELMHNQKFC